MKILRIIIYLIFTPILISCTGTKDIIEIGDLSNLNISGIKNNKIIFNGQLEITNHSYLPFKIKTIELAVIVDNIKTDL